MKTCRSSAPTTEKSQLRSVTTSRRTTRFRSRASRVTQANRTFFQSPPGTPGFQMLHRFSLETAASEMLTFSELLLLAKASHLKPTLDCKLITPPQQAD